MINIRKLEAELWESADLLRAGSKLTSNQYCMPVLGLIFLLRLRLKGLPRQVCKGFPPWPWSLALVFPRSGKGDVA